jgi:hypothetical protein
MRRVAWRSVAAAVLAFGLSAGCAKDSERPEYDQISGVVASIDKSSGEVTMSYFSEKHQKQVQIRGKLAPEAEILVDGATARLEDVRVGDRVKVRGRVEKKDSDRNWVALNVEISRRDGDSSTLPAGSAPAR